MKSIKNTKKEEVAKRLARQYFKIEKKLEQIIWVQPDRSKEIRFIEVNPTALPTGRVQPFYFRSSDEVPYPIYIAEITPEEWDKIQKHKIRLPKYWTLEGARCFTRNVLTVE